MQEKNKEKIKIVGRRPRWEKPGKIPSPVESAAAVEMKISKKPEIFKKVPRKPMDEHLDTARPFLYNVPFIPNSQGSSFEVG